jgi:hypothetical protein
MDEDIGGEYAAWFAETLEGATAVIYRPDWIVYGYAKTAEDIEGLVDGLRKQVQA